ncbi:MAG: radical SAM protein [Polyangia bacterium]
MRVLLINPPSRFEVIGNNPGVLEDSRGHNPPLGLLLVAGYLRRHSQHDIEVLDAQAEELSYARLAHRISRAAPDVVGVTAMTQTLIDVVRVVELVRARAPGARVVLGGPHVHLFPRETLDLPGVDYLVLGEGEIAFAELLERIDDPDALKRVAGIAFRDERGEAVITSRPAFIDDLDGLPFPARDLVDVNLYDSVLAASHPVTTVFTSRGCPYKCSFCDRPHLGKKFRARSAGDVVDELEQCVEMGIREFLVYDDTFTVKRERVLAICREILRRGLDIGFDVRARVDTVDREMLEWLARAGCRGIHYGVEAGTEKILTVLRKGIDLQLVERAFAETRRVGIPSLAYFMIGSPSETRADIEESFRVARRLDPDYLHLTILTPFPGTQIYEQGLRDGVFERDVWREFAARPHLGFSPPHWPEIFSAEELEELLVEGYRGFYRRPGYLIRRALAVRSAGELLRKARAGLRILGMRDRAGSRGESY